ncbi:NAD(P)H-hydrate dehydratase [Litoreibacter roseus]|uniref:Bifunctional NAD(P)H-hydrate repair enzyme n=1 Tax=Litoreibacter roseus TaxID=2601869 RepID=A0A6N6JK79_9RHOB|nr:NAD(P)H-hydrate dehydratase [Litoreibacter roseus]GFE66731.1 bifunctional NAD(P)H-hydrate repair enzyme [Litoreibacter roseus]
MTERLTAAQMRTTERAAIDSDLVTGLELMERAGRGVVDAIFEEWPDLAKTAHRAVVLCGPGNNGGDGFVIARLLKDWGWDVDVFLYGDPAKLPPDAKTNHDRWCKLGQVAALSNYTDGDTVHDIYIDALFGTGLGRPVDGHPARVLASLGYHEDRLVCVDIQSGLCADSGRMLGEQQAASAALTVTFHRTKLGHVLAQGPVASGRIKVVDIGLPADLKADPSIASGVYPDRLALRKGQASEHKYNHGHALILSGGPGKTGAARLAARGALRVGAGLVTVACPSAALQDCAAQLTAIMLEPVDAVVDLAAVLEDERLNALCIGPGLGTGQPTRELVAETLTTQRATVLDADALTAFTEDPAQLFDQLHEGCVLTPHGGEFSRLFSDIAEKLKQPATRGPAYSKVDATRAAAMRTGCVVLFKGPDTVIATPDGRCSINSAYNERAVPWLATAGAGDVLSGFITGLMARGLDAMAAAEGAAWLHVECARQFGPGLIAEDLPEQLPMVFRTLDV